MNPKFLLGIPEMDRQHARLFELAEKAQRNDMDEFEISDVILELITYANHHLEAEEEFLRQQGLSAFLIGHGPKHTAFRERAMSFYDSFRDAMSTEEKADVLKQVARFCETWLVDHINIEDRAYANLLGKK